MTDTLPAGVTWTESPDNPIVTVAWVIASESNTLGYRVLRSETSDRMSATVASNGIIAAYGDGGTYAWVDAEAFTSRGYYYWLEEIELDGQTVTDYGPAYAPLVQSYRSYIPEIRQALVGGPRQTSRVSETREVFHRQRALLRKAEI